MPGYKGKKYKVAKQGMPAGMKPKKKSAGKMKKKKK
mgnify:CR=1 FL=1|tara:strand:- start:761 stop:868 length:108 start_codon:yes stop_codon:yes gene_type:complete